MGIVRFLEWTVIIPLNSINKVIYTVLYTFMSNKVALTIIILEFGI